MEIAFSINNSGQRSQGVNIVANKAVEKPHSVC